MCETCSPISSMWPTIASVRPSEVPEMRANEEPRWSEPTSAANAEHASRQIRAASVSCPEGPDAVRRCCRNSGAGTRAQGYSQREEPGTGEPWPREGGRLSRASREDGDAGFGVSPRRVRISYMPGDPPGEVTKGHYHGALLPAGRLRKQLAGKRWFALRVQQLPQHVMEDPAVA